MWKLLRGLACDLFVYLEVSFKRLEELVIVET